MMTKRKNYTVIEKLKISKRVRTGESEATLFCEFGIPKGTIHGWVKKETDHIGL
jgi:hypothetical protein